MTDRSPSLAARACIYLFQAFIWMALAAFSWPEMARAESAPPAGIRQSIETRYTIIRYQNPDDLRNFYKRIDFSPRKWGLTRLFADSSKNSPDAEVAAKIDALYERVQEILDMRKKMGKLFINIYPDKRRLQEAYYNIYQQNKPLRAWYVFELNTIYLNAQDLNARILAHEMAHCIIDHYLLVRPPAASAEILARYVDSHLFD